MSYRRITSKKDAEAIVTYLRREANPWNAFYVRLIDVYIFLFKFQVTNPVLTLGFAG